MTREEAIQKREIIVTQFINEMGITIETNTKPLIHCKDCKYRGIIDYPVCCESTDEWFCADGERKGGDTEWTEKKSSNG